MKRINRIPDLAWTPLAQSQIEAAQGLLEQSFVAYQIKDKAIVGMVKPSLIGPIWLWFALAEDVTLRTLIDIRKLQDEIPFGTLTGVSDATCKRFAEFYGFRSIGQVIDGYEIMRKI